MAFGGDRVKTPPLGRLPGRTAAVSLYVCPETHVTVRVTGETANACHAPLDLASLMAHGWPWWDSRRRNGVLPTVERDMDSEPPEVCERNRNSGLHTATLAMELSRPERSAELQEHERR